MPPITRPLLIADRGPVELCVLDSKFVLRRSQVRAYPGQLPDFLVIFVHSSSTNSSHSCYYRDDPLIQSP
jgi:hypothetical protein